MASGLFSSRAAEPVLLVDCASQGPNNDLVTGSLWSVGKFEYLCYKPLNRFAENPNHFQYRDRQGVVVCRSLTVAVLT
jgi:hypothetical protein